MPPRKRPTYSAETIDQQLQQIHLLDPSSTSENLEQLGPIIKQIHTNKHQDAFLRTVQALVESKDAEIEKICSDNYQDFVSSVSTLLTVRSYTTSLQDRISSLDSSVSQVGHGLAEKKRALLKAKKTASNLDEAIDTLQACLRVLDVVHRVGQMVQEGRYWSALRSLEEIQTLPPSSLSQTPFFLHLLSSLPSLRAQVKDAVTASTKSWLLEIRNVSGQVGKLALEAMELRTRRWRKRRENDPLLKLSRVGSAVEMVTNEKIEYDVLDNDKVKVDFKPLYQNIHIYTALDSLEELQRSYQADRKAQSTLILPFPVPLPALPSLTQEITGFFIVESHVLRTTRGFRSEPEVEELWDGVVQRLSEGIEKALEKEKDNDPEVFLRIKECVLAFITTMEGYFYSTNQLHDLILVLFEKYATLLEKKFSVIFDQMVLEDDHLPIRVDNAQERDDILRSCWLRPSQADSLCKQNLPLTLPFSRSFHSCCKDIRSFVDKFYQFVEGVSQHHRDIDELLGKSLDQLLTKHVSDNIAKRLASTSTLSQIEQILTNLEHFEVACGELESSLASLRATQRGGSIHLESRNAFASTLQKAMARINTVISSKLNDFFELSEYDWKPSMKENAPSMYLYELVNWLTTVVDAWTNKDQYKEGAYGGAIRHVAKCFMDFITGRNIPVLNENSLSNLLVDVDFLDDTFKRRGRPDLCNHFDELRAMISIPLSDTVQDYLVPSVRQASYASVKPKALAALLDKLARYGASSKVGSERERGERRRKEAEAVGRLI